MSVRPETGQPLSPGRLLAAAAAGVAAVALSLWLVAARASADLARGEAIYMEACAACHGRDLQGQPDWRSPGPKGRLPAPPHDATGHTWHHPDRVLLDILRRGTAEVIGDGYESDMPGFAGTYAEAELRDVLAWIKLQWPERERDFQAQATRRDDAEAR